MSLLSPANIELPYCDALGMQIFQTLETKYIQRWYIFVSLSMLIPAKNTYWIVENVADDVHISPIKIVCLLSSLCTTPISMLSQICECFLVTLVFWIYGIHYPPRCDCVVVTYVRGFSSAQSTVQSPTKAVCAQPNQHRSTPTNITRWANVYLMLIYRMWQVAQHQTTPCQCLSSLAEFVI